MPDAPSGSPPPVPGPSSRETGPVGAAVRAEALRWRRLFLLSGLLVALTGGALLSYGVLGPPPEPAVPPELRGTWISDDPRYAGRALGFGENVVMLGTGDTARPEAHAVYDVRQQAGARVRRYLITYLSGRDDVTLTVLYRVGTPPVLELENPPGVVWRRAEQPTGNRQ